MAHKKEHLFYWLHCLSSISNSLCTHRWFHESFHQPSAFPHSASKHSKQINVITLASFLARWTACSTILVSVSYGSLIKLAGWFWFLLHAQDYHLFLCLSMCIWAGYIISNKSRKPGLGAAACQVPNVIWYFCVPLNSSFVFVSLVALMESGWSLIFPILIAVQRHQDSVTCCPRRQDIHKPLSSSVMTLMSFWCSCIMHGAKAGWVLAAAIQANYLIFRNPKTIGRKLSEYLMIDRLWKQWCTKSQKKCKI